MKKIDYQITAKTKLFLRSGSLTDLSPNAFIFTNNGSGNSNAGRFGNQFTFDGITQFFSNNIISQATIGTDYTIHVLVKLGLISSDQYIFSFTTNTLNDTYNNIIIGIVNSKWYFFIRGSTENLVTDNSKIVILNKWSLLSLTRNGSNISFYNDGCLVYSGSASFGTFILNFLITNGSSSDSI